MSDTGARLAHCDHTAGVGLPSVHVRSQGRDIVFVGVSCACSGGGMLPRLRRLRIA